MLKDYIGAKLCLAGMTTCTYLPGCDRQIFSYCTDLNSIRYAATDDLGKAITAIPDSGSRALLMLAVPLGRDENICGRNGCFKYT